MPRGDENLGDAKHGVDHELKQACEDIIFLCSDPIYSPLRTWVDHVHSHNTTLNAHPEQQPLTAQESFAQPAAEQLHENFRLAYSRDLRASVTRLRLYLEDDRTVGVLVGHVMDRIVDEYAAFREVVWNMYIGALRDVLFSTPTLRENLRAVCEGEVVSSAST